ncbi:hypothetical protein BOTBODRAFT_139343, partial [Botryobasidium botryosum FD-172 SS1]
MVPLLLAFLWLSGTPLVASSYAPFTNVQCPQEPLLRSVSPTNQSLHPQEVEYMSVRAPGIIAAWRSWLQNTSAIGYDLDALGGADGTRFPKVGIALSGGGYQAAQYGAGVLSALDGRNESAVAAGTGGLLQTASYITGLSGGSWLLTSLVFSSFPTLHDLVLGNIDTGGSTTGWLLDAHLFWPASTAFATPPNPTRVIGGLNFKWYRTIFNDLKQKVDAGEISLVEAWTRALAYHFLNGTTRSNFFDDSNHGKGMFISALPIRQCLLNQSAHTDVFWSSIPQIPAYQSHSMPFPIVVADSVPNNQSDNHYMPLWSTVYEFTPYEMGSWDPQLSMFTNMKYVGTTLNKGAPLNSTSCVIGFDQADFVFGTSSALFNRVEDIAMILGKVLRLIFNGIRYRFKFGVHQDVAVWVNPFKGISPGIFQDSMSSHLHLVDGSDNLENIPLGPLMVKARGLDFIVASEGGGHELNDWPSGESLYASAYRTVNVLSNVSQGFPPLPNDPNNFIPFGLNQRPTLFGCDPTRNPPEWPLIMYLPNAPPVDGSDPVTNAGALRLRYTTNHTARILDASQAGTTSGFLPGKGGADPNWGKCFQCAAVDRARYKSSPVIPRSQFCQGCFTQYCYNANSPTPPPAIVGRQYLFVDPDPQNGLTILGQFKPLIIALVTLVVVFIVAGIAACCFCKRRQRKVRRSEKAALLDQEAAQQEGVESIELTKL